MKRRYLEPETTPVPPEESLCRALLSLDTPAEMLAFLRDLCTPAELEALVDRWRVVPYLLAGYAYATKWRVRHAYRYSVETSVYVGAGHGRKGYGSALYGELLRRLRTSGCHLAIAGIAQPNEASVALHERMGFRKVAHFGEVGFKFGRWLDVGYWELRL